MTSDHCPAVRIDDKRWLAFSDSCSDSGAFYEAVTGAGQRHLVSQRPLHIDALEGSNGHRRDVPLGHSDLVAAKILVMADVKHPASSYGFIEMLKSKRRAEP